MITCNRCRRQIQAGLADCQYCGMPVAGAPAGGADPRMGAREQPELPAWLESLRAGEQPIPSASEQPDFFSADLVDEGMLPNWMRSEGADDAPSGPLPAWRPASMPAPNTDGGILPPTSFSANSLIDEHSLPAWMQEKQPSSEYPAQRNLAASGLVQPDAIPDWMRNIEPQSPQSPQSAAPKPAQQAEPVLPPQGLSARDFIDPQSLPPWMSGQQVPSAEIGQAGLPAASLLDMQAIPPWLRENRQQEAGDDFGAINRAPTSGAINRSPTSQSWEMPNQPLQVPNGHDHLSASSFIDMNSLPAWLRPVADARQAGGSSPMPGNPRPASFGVPPRVENVRVPSRPRSELGPHEDSEVAANVFASMLGVASVAPYFPARSPNPGRAQVPPQNQQAMPPRGNEMPGTPPGFAGPPASPGYIPGGYPMGDNQPGAGSVLPSGAQWGRYSGAERVPQPPPMSRSGMPPGSGQIMPGQPKPNTKPAKRGFLDAIRDWFSR